MKVLMLAVVVAGCMSPVMTFGGGKTAKEAQRDTMGDLMPVPLDTEGAWKGTITSATIRVWADEAYRAQNVHWQRGFDEQLAYTNAVVGPMFGLRLRADYKPWNRHPGTGRLAETMEALQAHDRGDDVFAVVGLTSSLSLVSATFDELGLGELGGKHIVMRGYADLEERSGFSRAFPDLPADERESVLDARRAHKLASTLLHELGHTLGWQHDDERDTIMAPLYSHQARTFTPASRATILASVDRRLGRAGAVPEAAPQVSAPAQVKSPPVAIFVTDAGEIVLDGTYIVIDQLDLIFSATAARDAKTEVIIKRGRKSPAGILVDIIDRAKKHGLENFTLGG